MKWYQEYFLEPKLIANTDPEVTVLEVAKESQAAPQPKA
jgi:hypothetical protein